LILIFDGIIEKTKHKPLLPEFRISKFVAKHYIIIAIVFVVLWIPAVFGYNRTSVYYNLDSTLPESLPSIQANNILNDKFAMNTMEIVLVDTNLSAKQKMQLANDMKNVDGVKTVLGLDALVGPAIPDELIPDDIKSELIQSGREMMLVMSEYKVASDEVNEQCNKEL
jgi:predicted RND superfamily exporter protein